MCASGTQKMVDHTSEYAPILQRAIVSYNGLIELYQQDVTSSPYFEHSLAETKRNGLQDRLADPSSWKSTFRGTYYQSIDHFLDEHRGEYGPDMPGPNPTKAEATDAYLTELRGAMKEMLRVGRALELGV